MGVVKKGLRSSKHNAVSEALLKLTKPFCLTMLLTHFMIVRVCELDKLCIDRSAGIV